MAKKTYTRAQLVKAELEYRLNFEKNPEGFAEAENHPSLKQSGHNIDYLLSLVK